MNVSMSNIDSLRLSAATVSIIHSYYYYHKVLGHGVRPIAYSRGLLKL